MIGTGGEEWTIRSNFEGQPITPSNIKAGRRGAYSSARLPARVTQDSALFVQRNERDASNWKWVGRWERMHR